MNEPPGLPSALGIEAVEWLAQGAESLTVRVRGRWRRRRPTWSGQPLLVIEAGGSRHRYPAMPEPPSLTGAAPGTWQMSFSVPASVAGRTGIRAWLQLGSVVVALPVPVEQTESAAAPDEETLSLRRVRAAELTAEAAARRAAEAQAEAEALRARVDQLWAELERLRGLAEDRGRAIRAAEQAAHAERELRLELEDRLAEIGGGPERTEADERELRIAELEREVEQLRRAVDEAEYVARTAVAGRRRAEQLVEALTPRQSSPLASRSLSIELELVGSAAPAAPAGRHGSSLPEGDLQRLHREQRLIEARASTVPAQAAPDVSARPDPALRSTLAELRQELAHLRAALAAESGDRELAEQRVAHAYDAIQEVRDGLKRLRFGEPSEATRVDPPGAVEADRLTVALERLRDRTPPPGDQPESETTEWLLKALSLLARNDPAGAGRVLGAMLPASAPEARLAARLLAAGRLRRRLRRGAARFRGRGTLIASLDELLRQPLRLAELRIEPRAALILAGAMIEPAWSGGERFTIAYNSGPYLHIRGADRPLVGDATLGAVATTIVCDPELLAAVLAGERPPGTVIVGDQRPVELVHAWLERAQSG